MVENMWGLGIGGGALIGIGAFLYTWISGRKGKDSAKDAQNLRDLIRDKSEAVIETTAHEQSQVEIKIDVIEELATEKRDAIRQIADKAAEKVDAIMKEDDMSKVTSIINSGDF